MAKKKGRSKGKPAQKPKSLQKQLGKAEDTLDKAVAKRDRAQARVDALSIIADEIRAQLAEVEKARAAESGRVVTSDGTKPVAAVTPARKKAATRKPAAARPATRKPASPKPAAARSTTTKATTAKQAPKPPVE
jgi:hypothetical protein